MPEKNDKRGYPHMPLKVLETIRQAWRKSTARPVTQDWIEKTCSCKPGSSRRYHAELRSMGLVGEDGKISPTAFDWAVEDGEKRAKAAMQIAETCWPDEVKMVRAGQFENYDALKKHFRRHGINTDSGALNIARLFCHLLADAGEKLPTDSPGTKKDN